MSDTSTAQDEVVELCRELLMIDTSNFGDGSGPGERKAAEHVMTRLDEVGLQAELIESEPGRASVVLRIEGEDPGRDALLLHGHLDVVPAQADDWQVDPFGGEVRDDCLWGRGAVDMKGMDAMLLATVRQLAREGRKPPRDLVVAFFADEEAGGSKGASWLVDHRPELFEGVTEAVSEVGGFSIDVDGQRCYLLQTAEKGIAWLRLVAHGRAGHGSQVNTDNAVTRLAAAVTRVGQHDWPIEWTPTVREFLDGVSEITGVELDPSDPQELLDRLGTTARWVGATLRNTTNPTVLDAGYKHNVIPGTASALIDCRPLAGHEDELMSTVRELAGDGRRRRGGAQRHLAADRLRGPAQGRHGRRPDGRGPVGPGAAVLPVRRHRQQVDEPPRHHRLRLRTAETACRTRLLGHVPRRGRAGAARRPAVRRAGARPVRAGELIRGQRVRASAAPAGSVGAA